MRVYSGLTACPLFGGDTDQTFLDCVNKGYDLMETGRRYARSVRVNGEGWVIDRLVLQVDVLTSILYNPTSNLNNSVPVLDGLEIERSDESSMERHDLFKFTHEVKPALHTIQLRVAEKDTSGKRID